MVSNRKVQSLSTLLTLPYNHFCIKMSFLVSVLINFMTFPSPISDIITIFAADLRPIGPFPRHIEITKRYARLADRNVRNFCSTQGKCDGSRK